MSEFTLYHNPRCSKSRAAVALLEEHGRSFDTVLYLETPPSAEVLRALLSKLGLTARQLLRTGEDEYAELGLSDSTLSEETLIDAMAKHPRLIERPIVVAADRAVIGRPTERILELLA